jgi:hypothetical protein
MLCVIMLNLIFLSIFMPSVFTLCAIMLSVILLNVVAPFTDTRPFYVTAEVQLLSPLRPRMSQASGVTISVQTHNRYLILIWKKEYSRLD